MTQQRYPKPFGRFGDLFSNSCKVNAGWVFLSGFLVMAAGSAASFLYFGAAIVALAMIIKGKSRLVLDHTYNFTLIACMLLWLSKITSAVLFPNALEGWSIVFGNLQMATIALIVTNFMRSQQLDVFSLYISGLSWGLPVAFLIGLVQLLTPIIGPIEGAMGNMLVYSSLTLLAGLMCLAFPTDAANSRHNRAILIALISAAAISGMVLRYSSFLTLALLLVPILIYCYRKFHRQRRLLLLVPAIVLATVIAFLGISQNIKSSLFYDKVATPLRIAKENNYNPAEVLFQVQEQRILMYKYGWQVFLSKPLTGVGFQNGVSEVRKLVEQDDDAPLFADYGHLHNAYLNQAVGSGIWGVAALLLVFAAPIIMAYRSKRDQRWADRLYFSIILCGGFAAMSLTNLFTSHDLILSFFFLSLSVLIMACYQANRDIAPLPLKKLTG